MRIRVRVNDIVGRPLQAHPQVDGAGPCAKLVHAQGTAQALWASLRSSKRVWCRARLRAYRVAP